jgi:uncharacterized protein YuzE
MKTESHSIVVKSQGTPVVEIDTEAQAVYVRFKRSKVVKTIERESKTMFVTIDLDSSNEVVGIEVVGAGNFNIHKILDIADLKCPRLDDSKVRYISAALAA